MSAPGTDDAPGLRSFSQYGEDLILWDFLGGKPAGFFVEIGANHPTALSNTWFFEQRGWCGIVVEPIPDNCQKLRDARPGSQVVQAPGVNSWYVPANARAIPATPFTVFKMRLQVGYTLMRRGLRSRFKRLISGGGRDDTPPASQ